MAFVLATRASRCAPAWYAAAAVLVAPVLLSACGAPASRDEDQSTGRTRSSDPVSATVESYFRAVDRGDGAAICARLSERLRRDVARLQSAPCEKALAEEASRLPENLNAYRIVGVRRTGGIAAVSLDGGGFREEMLLERAGRAWTITNAPGLGQ